MEKIKISQIIVVEGKYDAIKLDSFVDGLIIPVNGFSIFKDAENLSQMGLGIPDITKVFLKLKEMGVDIDTDVYTIPYAIKTLLKFKEKNGGEQNA